MIDSLREFFETPHWERQHRWRRAIWRNMSRLGLTGMHGLPVNRRWVDIQRHPMGLERLDPAFAGLKLVQISDLHYSPVVWKRYLMQFVTWVNDLQPDLVVVTGDLITGGYRYAEKVGELLIQLRAPLGVVCTFGNHDYSMHGKRDPFEAQRRGDHLAEALRAQGLIVLRNEWMEVDRPGAKRPVVLVGLDDEWSGAIDAAKAFAGVDAGLPVICLNHNPANVQELMEFPWQWMLSGHTHGRQVATSRFGRAFYPQRYRHYTHGYYAVSGRHLYVNRGLSYGQRMRDWCRPEITVFRLEGVTDASEVKLEGSRAC